MRGRFYFRGMSSSGYGLVSSLDRWHGSSLNEYGLSRTDAAEKFINHFKEEAARLSPDPLEGLNDDEVLGYAQHYGLPTRLLDWTESPYIAAFFAFAGLAENFDKPGEVAIWRLDIKSKVWEGDQGLKLVSLPSPYNDRLKGQLGKFTLLSSFKNALEEQIAECDPTGTAVQKVTIPAAEARTALSDLDFMGINYSSIYPGADGSARAARLRVVLGQ
jgi:FRG domain